MLAELQAAQERLDLIARNAESWHAGEDGKAKALAVIASWAKGEPLPEVLRGSWDTLATEEEPRGQRQIGDGFVEGDLDDEPEMYQSCLDGHGCSTPERCREANRCWQLWEEFGADYPPPPLREARPNDPPLGRVRLA
jgi:hypothetical protein